MLFENNNYFDLLNVYQNLNVKESNDNFFKGNMFDNEYIAYKNYQIKEYVPKTDQEKILLDIMKYSFAVNDYNLFLDLHPDDQTILIKYQKVAKRLNELTKQYEKTYGPLTINNSEYETFKWVESPWPWERDDSKYV